MAQRVKRLKKSGEVWRRLRCLTEWHTCVFVCQRKKWEERDREVKEGELRHLNEWCTCAHVCGSDVEGGSYEKST